MSDSKNQAIRVTDLCYYFDSQERDRLDRGGLGRKSSQLLALREKLMSLPEAQFDLAIKTLEKMVAESGPVTPDPRTIKPDSPRAREAAELFNQTTRTSGGSSSGKISRA